MKHAILILALSVLLLFVSCASQQHMLKERSNKALIVLRESWESGDEESFETLEAIEITRILEEAGFQAVMASASGKSFFQEDSPKSYKTLKLANVKVSYYEAFIFPADNRKSLYEAKENATPEASTIVNQAVAEGKLVAAQRWGVVVLAEAGVLDERQFAFPINLNPQEDVRFANAINNWNKMEFIVQDKNIITTSLCPYKNPGIELTKALITELQK